MENNTHATGCQFSSYIFRLVSDLHAENGEGLGQMLCYVDPAEQAQPVIDV